MMSRVSCKRVVVAFKSAMSDPSEPPVPEICDCVVCTRARVAVTVSSRWRSVVSTPPKIVSRRPYTSAIKRFRFCVVVVRSRTSCASCLPVSSARKVAIVVLRLSATPCRSETNAVTFALLSAVKTCSSSVFMTRLARSAMSES